MQVYHHRINSYNYVQKVHFVKTILHRTVRAINNFRDNQSMPKKSYVKTGFIKRNSIFNAAKYNLDCVSVILSPYGFLWESTMAFSQEDGLRVKQQQTTLGQMLKMHRPNQHKLASDIQRAFFFVLARSSHGHTLPRARERVVSSSSY